MFGIIKTNEFEGGRFWQLLGDRKGLNFDQFFK